MIRLSLVLSLLTTRNSISPLRSSMTAGYDGVRTWLCAPRVPNTRTFSGNGTTLGLLSASGVIVDECEFLMRFLGLSLPSWSTALRLVSRIMSVASSRPRTKVPTFKYHWRHICTMARMRRCCSSVSGRDVDTRR